MRGVQVLVAAAVLVVTGCIGPDDLAPTGARGGVTSVTPVAERADLPFATGGNWSVVLEPGAFAILPAVSVDLPVQVPAGNGLSTQNVNLGLFMPDIPGCDWTAAELPASCKVPVVADVGPYYADLDLPSNEPALRLGKFLIENLVPHGYAVAQVSVFGTGRSGGCMDLMGEVEQAGVQGAVEWLATQAWSNGNVGLIGRSYDGSTPWEAAMGGSTHLKTIVPISGLQGQYDLMWRNGSAEDRGGRGGLWRSYYQFTLTPGEVLFREPPVRPPSPLVPDPTRYLPTPGYAPTHAQRIAENTICPDTQTGGAQMVAAWLNGAAPAPERNTYFAERSFTEEVLANYKGSIYFIHGLQDWNVDPHQAFPAYQQYEAAGLEMKGLFGQWAHNYPDRLAEHLSCDGEPGNCKPPFSVRYDWAQDLLEWFDHYLKDLDAKPQLHVEVQDDHGAWRIEPTWPPADVAWKELALGADLALVGTRPPVVVPDVPAYLDESQVPGPDVFSRPTAVLFRSKPVHEALRIAGLATFHVAVTPAGPGGQLYVELRDVDEGGRRVGHAIMDLRFAEGGSTPKPVTPGASLVARMEFFAMDAVIPAGHRLELFVSGNGQDYMSSAVHAPVRIEVGPESVLRLPTILRTPEDFFAPPGIDPATPVA